MEMIDALPHVNVQFAETPTANPCRPASYKTCQSRNSIRCIQHPRQQSNPLWPSGNVVGIKASKIFHVSTLSALDQLATTPLDVSLNDRVHHHVDLATDALSLLNGFTHF